MAHLVETIVEEVVEPQRHDSPGQPAHEPLFNVILLNDDHHSDAYVVDMLGRLFCIPPAPAFRLAVEVDTAGRAIVMTCELPQAQFARDQIHAFGRDPRIQTCRGSMSAVVEPAPQ